METIVSYWARRGKSFDDMLQELEEKQRKKARNIMLHFKAQHENKQEAVAGDFPDWLLYQEDSFAKIVRYYHVEMAGLSRYVPINRTTLIRVRNGDIRPGVDSAEYIARGLSAFLLEKRGVRVDLKVPMLWIGKLSKRKHKGKVANEGRTDQENH